MRHRVTARPEIPDFSNRRDEIGHLARALDIDPSSEPVPSCEPATQESVTDYFRGPRYPFSERLKMLLLFDRSAKHRALVLGTSNKT